jgi:hypothetical protein
MVKVDDISLSEFLHISSENVDARKRLVEENKCT